MRKVKFDKSDKTVKDSSYDIRDNHLYVDFFKVVEADKRRRASESGVKRAVTFDKI